MSFNHYKGFISEYTASFFLVERLRSALKSHYKHIIPVFPWATREGSSMSNYLNKDQTFKIVGIYPRRPKFSRQETDKVVFKINEYLGYSADLLTKEGIPTFAGLPLARNILELGMNSSYLWLELDQKNKEHIQITLDQKGQPIQLDKNMVVLSNEEVVSFIKKESDVMEIKSFFEITKKVNDEVRKTFQINWSPYGNNFYKPFYLFLE